MCTSTAYTGGNYEVESDPTPSPQEGLRDFGRCYKEYTIDSVARKRGT